MTDRFYAQIPIFLLLKSPSVVDHFKKLFHKMNRNAFFYKNTQELFERIVNHKKAIIFVEDVISQEEGFEFYRTILEKCPRAKIILVCKRDRRNLIKDVVEKGGYGSILEPYDPWEVAIIVKHLLSDLSENEGNFNLDSEKSTKGCN